MSGYIITTQRQPRRKRTCRDCKADLAEAAPGEGAAGLTWRSPVSRLF